MKPFHIEVKEGLINNVSFQKVFHKTSGGRGKKVRYGKRNLNDRRLERRGRKGDWDHLHNSLVLGSLLKLMVATQVRLGET
jgi:hypothetical protein